MADPVLDNPSHSTINKLHQMAGYWASTTNTLRHAFVPLDYVQNIDLYIVEYMKSSPAAPPNPLVSSYLNSTLSLDRFSFLSGPSVPNLPGEAMVIDQAGQVRKINWLDADVRQFALSVCLPITFQIYMSNVTKILHPLGTDQPSLRVRNMRDYRIFLGIIFKGYWLPHTSLFKNLEDYRSMRGMISQAVYFGFVRMGRDRANNSA